MDDSTTFVAACRALADALPRLTELLRRSQAVSAPAVGTWGVAEVACHVSHVIQKDTDAVLGKPLPDIELSPAAVGVMTASLLDEDPERNVTVLADRIDAVGSAFVDLAADPPSEPISWIGGTQLPPSAVACHLLEEVLVHGFDLATAARRRWRLEPAHAALAIAGGAVPIIAASPQSWVRAGYDLRVRARVEFRLRRHERFVLVLDNGLRAELPPSGPRADAYVSATPADLLLVMLGRQSQWRAAVRGKIAVWGRRPQALFTLLANVSPP